MLAEIFGVDGIIVLIVVLVVLFGGAAIPKLARNLGSAKNEFEKGLKEPAAVTRPGPTQGRTRTRGKTSRRAGPPPARPRRRRPAPANLVRSCPGRPAAPTRCTQGGSRGPGRPRAGRPALAGRGRRPASSTRSATSGAWPRSPTAWPSSRPSPTSRPSPPTTGWSWSTPGSAPWPPSSTSELRRWSTRPAPHRDLLPRPHRPRLRRRRCWSRRRPTNGWPAPTVVAHEALPAPLRPLRRDRRLQPDHQPAPVRLPGPRWPTEYRYPDRTYADDLDLEVGGTAFDLRHEKGETDDHTVTWLADRRVLCCGDLFIWASPNAGNPQKVQRYPREWAEALRRMVALEPEVPAPGPRVPGHRRRAGPPGADRHRRPPRLPGRPDPRAHERGRPPRRGPAHGAPARPPRRPALPAAGLRRARVRRPQRLAPLRRVVGRQPGHPQAGPRAGPGRRSWPSWPAGPARWPTGPWRAGSRRAAGGRRAEGRRALRLAGHLAELGLAGRPGRPRGPGAPGRGLLGPGRAGDLDHGQGGLPLGRPRSPRPSARPSDAG